MALFLLTLVCLEIYRSEQEDDFCQSQILKTCYDPLVTQNEQEKHFILNITRILYLETSFQTLQGT